MCEGVLLNDMIQKEFIVGDLVSYGTNGICTIERIDMISMVTDMPEEPYYVLKPESNAASTVYVPQKNEKLVSKMRSLLTREEIDQMIFEAGEEDLSWNNDRRFRNDSYHRILSDGVSKDMLLMIGCILDRKEKLLGEGKKLPTTDTNTLKQAERLVNEELSRVLGIEPEHVPDYIRMKLGME